jgi:hypothetical protein
MATTESRSQGLALAGGAIVASLLDALVAKGTLTSAEIRSVLTGALQLVSSYHGAPGSLDASEIIAAIMRERFPKSSD